MRSKYSGREFGVCLRAKCQQQRLLPVGITEEASTEGVRLYCAHCEELYVPSTPSHRDIDGAFFGTTFAHLFLMEFPLFRPQRVSSMKRRYRPKIFGYPLHESWHKVALHSFERRLMTHRGPKRPKRSRQTVECGRGQTQSGGTDLEEDGGDGVRNGNGDEEDERTELEYLRKWKGLQIEETQRMKELLQTKEERIGDLERVWSIE